MTGPGCPILVGTCLDRRNVIEQYLGCYELTEFITVVGLSASSTQQFFTRVMVTLAVELGVAGAGALWPSTRARPDINVRLVRGGPVLATKVPGASALLVALWLVQLLTGPGAAKADPGLALWTSAIQARDVVALSQLLGSGFSQVNVASAKGKTALMVSAQAAEQTLSRALVDSGADVNARNENGGTPLMHAAVSGDLDIVVLFLDSGAEVDAQAFNGWTPLALAAAKGHVQVVHHLLKSGADANLADAFGWTALMHAAEQKRLKVVQLLAAQPGIQIDARSVNGTTALHRAAAQGFPAIAHMLIQGGADSKISDNEGRTALDYAREAGHPQLLEGLGG